MAATQDINKLARVAEWLRVEWSDLQIAQFDRYEEWLRDEAIVAGGVGSGESNRLFDRHIGDSLAFLRVIGHDVPSLVDVGSGVGLPGIPIAIARPEIAVTLLDRSERRSSLASRAIRILRLENVSVVNDDAARARGPSGEETHDVVAFRASLPIKAAVDAYHRLAGPGGIGVFAWSRRSEPKSPPEAPTGTIFTLTSEGDGVLSSPAWILRMERSP